MQLKPQIVLYLFLLSIFGASGKLWAEEDILRHKYTTADFINPFLALYHNTNDTTPLGLQDLISYSNDNCIAGVEPVPGSKLYFLYESLCALPELYQDYSTRIKLLKSKSNSMVRFPQVWNIEDLLAGNWNRRRLVVNLQAEPVKFVMDTLLLKLALKKSLADITTLFRDFWAPKVYTGFLFIHPKIRASFSSENSLLSLYEYYDHIKCSLLSGHLSRDYYCEAYKNYLASLLNTELKKSTEMLAQLEHGLSILGASTQDGRLVHRFANIKATALEYFALHRSEIGASELRKYLQQSAPLPSGLEDFKTAFERLVRYPLSLNNDDALLAYRSISVFTQVLRVKQLAAKHKFPEGQMGKEVGKEVIFTSPVYLQFSKNIITELQIISSQIYILLEAELTGF